MITYKITKEPDDRYRIDLEVGGTSFYSVWLTEDGTVYTLKHVSESFLYFLAEAEKKEIPSATKPTS